MTASDETRESPTEQQGFYKDLDQLTGPGPRMLPLWLRRIYVQVLRYSHVEISDAIGHHQTVLDVGCGFASILGALPRPGFSVGIDIFFPDLQLSKSLGIHSHYLHMNALSIGDCFRRGSFDVVMALDVIEHLTHEDGLRLLQMMESVAKYRVIVSTPNGYRPNALFHGNPWQRHLSGWTTEDMTALGYRVVGVNGWKPLRGEHGAIALRPRLLWELVSDLTRPLVRNRPECADLLLCIKDAAS